ncbi:MULTISPECIES: alkylphosphonate utilization protein [unclassified Oceanobacter]|jgi:protein PhnA|uniref:PhnA domain-containing protein n=1 Tax=unclassified Oceanobacter TaxID=2620260 RepID=UPI0026E46D74|nr:MULTISPECIES: alkylphosphonate utilization protein [unclassified Oceanobacter]MDO6682608.1 PhnA domain-containing protein [Oceanobacter sp. 5_MG-2023]MDP2506824.1 PhnA domain-containing protein [Oceanobacter sp. 3_MG-2023]MDP2547867.1 PhnA domain-containing protein [Oceanobacter sp. 4_MG-2023]
MSIEHTLLERSNHSCELCGATDDLSPWAVPPQELASSDNHILLCPHCLAQIEGAELDQNHWRCLNDSMWSQVPVVQVMAYRMLKRLSTETWAQDLMDMLYLEDDTRKWAEAGAAAEDEEPTLDVNGVALAAGDNVTLIKDLDVKGTSMTAKRGTAVRGISLSDNPKHIEGRVNGQRIVIIAAYCKKS